MLCMHFFCLARDVEETFLQANRCYQNKEYKDSLNLYSSIECKGCATWQNMGNCSFKMNNHINALLYWKRAEKDASSAQLQDIRKNIVTVNEILGREPERESFWKFIKDILSRFSMFFFQLMFLFMWFLFFLSIWFFKNSKRKLAALFLPINMIFGSAIVIKYQLNLYPSALVIKSASVFAGPDKHYHVINKVKLADQIIVLKQRDKWCRVKNKSLSGWILADTIEVI